MTNNEKNKNTVNINLDSNDLNGAILKGNYIAKGITKNGKIIISIPNEPIVKEIYQDTMKR